VRTLPLILTIRNRKLRRQKTQQRAAAGWRGTGRVLAAVLSLVAGVAALLGGWQYAQITRDLPSIESLPFLLDRQNGTLLQPTRLYDRTGETLLQTLEVPGVQRRFLSADLNEEEHFSPHLLRLTVAVLEPGFWKSAGFSLAAWQRTEPQTIAERLVDDLLLNGEPRSLQQAARMRILAGQATALFSRTQILEWYLNSASYGHQIYGAENAARFYLGKTAQDLTLAESALLVTVAGSPALNPADAPAAALELQRELLISLQQKGMINAVEMDAALAEKVTFARTTNAASGLAPALTRLALEQMAKTAGDQAVERGGWRILTTLDADLQRQLECAAHTQLLRVEGYVEDGRMECSAARLLPGLTENGGYLPASLTASAVVIDPQNGQILALLGDTMLSGESSTLSERPAGSLLTPLVALAGFTRGLSPASLLWDLPGEGVNGANPDGDTHGPVRLRTAVANDIIRPLADWLVQMGSESVWRVLRPLGLELTVAANGADALFGGASVDLVETSKVFAILANRGLRPAQAAPNDSDGPGIILQAEAPDGSIYSASEPAGNEPVVSEGLAYLVNNILSDSAARRASLGYPNALEIGRPAAAKMGTAEHGRQAWAVGYTPYRVALVSFYLPESEVGNRVSPDIAGGLWHAVMQTASLNLSPDGWEIPAGVVETEVCDPSGLLPTAACPNRVQEIFLQGTEPSSYDTLYRSLEINRETGRLATVFTRPELIEEQVYLMLPENARAWALSHGVPMPPDGYDVIQSPVVQAGVSLSEPAFFAYVNGKVVVKGTAAGEQFTSYALQAGQGINPQTWIQIDETRTSPVTGGKLGEWDTGGLNGLYALRLVVVRTDQRVDTAVIQVTVDNTPPALASTYPLAGAALQAVNGSLTLQAEVGDEVGLERVEWWLDGKKACVRSTAPFVCVWSGKTGRHTLLLKAVDLAGNQSETERITFDVVK